MNSSPFPRATPGPWRVSMSGFSVKSNDDDMPIVANNPWGVAMREKDAPRWLANAELIAAAPDLLIEVSEARKQLADLPLEAIRSAAGLCQSEARKWESIDPRTSQHWEGVARQLQSLDVCIHVWRDQFLATERRAT